MKIKSLLLVFGLALLTQGIALANVDVINLEDHKEGIISLDDATATHTALTKQQKKEAKQLARKQKRTERKMAKLQKFMASEKGQKMLGGLDDPVDKWFWYWLIAWGAALLLNIIFWVAAGTGAAFFSGGWVIIALLSTLLWIGGLVALILWLVKKFA